MDLSRHQQPPFQPDEAVDSISKLVALCHYMAERGGWYNPPRSFGEDIALIHSELSEALEEFRSNHTLQEIYYNTDNPSKPEGIPVELADAVIRIAQVCGHHGIDLTKALELKLFYNSTRAYRHGGKAL